MVLIHTFVRPNGETLTIKAAFTDEKTNTIWIQLESGYARWFHEYELDIREPFVFYRDQSPPPVS